MKDTQKFPFEISFVYMRYIKYLYFSFYNKSTETE